MLIDLDVVTHIKGRSLVNDARATYILRRRWILQYPALNHANIRGQAFSAARTLMVSKSIDLVMLRGFVHDSPKFSILVRNVDLQKDIRCHVWVARVVLHPRLWVLLGKFA